MCKQLLCVIFSLYSSSRLEDQLNVFQESRIFPLYLKEFGPLKMNHNELQNCCKGSDQFLLHDKKMKLSYK